MHLLFTVRFLEVNATCRGAVSRLCCSFSLIQFTADFEWLTVRSGPSLQYSWDLRPDKILETHLGFIAMSPVFRTVGTPTPLYSQPARLLGCWGVFFVFQSSLLLSVEISFSFGLWRTAAQRSKITSEGFSQPPAESLGFGSGKSRLLRGVLMHLQTSTVGHWLTSGGLLSTLQPVPHASRKRLL